MLYTCVHKKIIAVKCLSYKCTCVYTSSLLFPWKQVDIILRFDQGKRKDFENFMLHNYLLKNKTDTDYTYVTFSFYFKAYR